MSTKGVRPSTQAGREVGETAVVTGSIVSGGVFGVALSSLAKTLRPPWDTTALTLVPTITAAWSILISGTARWLRRNYHSRSWRVDRDRFIAWVEAAIPAAQEGLQQTSTADARVVFEQNIARLETLRALALTSVPYERPWETNQSEIARGRKGLLRKELETGA